MERRGKIKIEDVEAIAEWCDYTFDTRTIIEDNWVRITSETKSVFFFNLDDMKRFGKYTMFHKPFGKNNSHVQKKDTSIFFLFFCAGTHDLYKYVLKMQWSKKDYKRWLSDFYFLRRSGLI